ncbi:acyltransferase [Aneurinibacillus sp. REN35]|uniref:acyltransferase n=1 Tax=Aneurinibacillus sp. REN35 TaxID=3237286 RepID=UPI003527BC64
MKQRLYEFDEIRAFAALSVIAIHTTAPYVTTETAGFIWNQLMRYAVPLFIILSGFLLYYADRKKERLAYGPFMKKRVTKIFIPYVIWTVFYTCFKLRDVVAEKGTEALPDVWEAVLTYLPDGSAFVHLYFLIIMFQLYLLYPLLRLWVRRAPRQALVLSFLLTFLAQTWAYIHDITKIGVQIPYVTRIFPVWLFFFILGMYTAHHKENWERRLKQRGIMLVGVWITAVLLLLVDSHVTGTYGASIKPTVVLYTIASYFLFYYVCMSRKRSDTARPGFILWLSAQSFLVFLLHPFVLTMLRLWPRWYGQDTFWDGSLGMIGLSLATIVITLCMTYLISFTPLASVLGGVRRGKK